VVTCQIGGYSPHPQNCNGTRFQHFANEFNIAAMNTFIQNASEWTRVGSRGHKNRINYILGKADHKFCFVDGPRKSAAKHSDLVRRAAHIALIAALRAWGLSSTAYAWAPSMVTKSVCIDKNNMVDDLNNQAEQAERLGDRRKLYKVAQSSAGVQRGQMKTVRGEDGSVTTKDAAYARCFTQHFANVLGATLADAPEVDDQTGV
ncbi:unnamed protein product, partial [Prorocentrum cordatum]